jgi:peptidoglycan/LPS O-acetylase OafA/YrhL
MPNRIAPLTGLRAFAAAAVCATHAAFRTGHYTDDFTGHLWARFEIGVPLFFALSGFLLFRPWVTTLTAGPPAQPSLRRYAWHRFRRVVPAYWVTVTLVYLIGLVRPEPNPSGHGFIGYLRHLPFLQIYGFGHLRVGLTHTWSLCIEMAFYLTLPLVGWVLTALVCRYRWRPWLLLACLAALSAVTAWWIWVAPGVQLTARMWPPAYGWWFFAGMMLTVIAAMAPRWPRWGTPVSLLVALAAFLAAAATGGPPTMVPSDYLQAVGKSALYLVVAVAVIAPLALNTGRPHGWYQRVLGWRPIVWLGGISYEFFLLHMMVMEIVTANLFGWGPFAGNLYLAFLVTSIITIPLAWALRAALPFEAGNGRSQEVKDAADSGGAVRRAGAPLV